MSLLSDWNQLLEGKGLSEQQAQAFWNAYLAQEKEIYSAILDGKNTQLKGTVSEFAEAHDLTPELAVGFLDGIGTSLTEALELETFTEDTAFDVTIDFEKLYLNMHKAKAEWLYTLPQWEDILTKEQRQSIKQAYTDSVVYRVKDRIGRNDPCPCGSGKKYKKCCIDKVQPDA